MRWQAKNAYGLTLGEYDEMKAKAIGCHICGKTEKLVLDHDSNTGLLRAFLCGTCNTGLGLFRHSRVLLRDAMEYLEVHESGPTFKLGEHVHD